MSMSDAEIEFFEAVSEQCHCEGHKWVSYEQAQADLLKELSPFLIPVIQAFTLKSDNRQKICIRCGEYGLTCPGCDRTPEQLEDSYLSILNKGACYDCSNDDESGYNAALQKVCWEAIEKDSREHERGRLERAGVDPNLAVGGEP